MASAAPRALVSTTLALCFGLACASGPVPVDHFYRLSVPPPTVQARAPLAGGITVDALETDALTGERPIVYVVRMDGERAVEIGQHHYHHWTEAPGTALQQALAVHIEKAGLADRVVTPELRVPTRYRVSGRVTRFERVPDTSSVVVEMRLSLQDGERGRIVSSKTYQAKVTAPGADVASSIAAFDAALAQIFDRFVADVSSGRSVDEPAL